MIWPLSSNSRYKSKTIADEAVSVVLLTSSSGGYINGRNSANLELLIDKTSSIYLYVKLQALVSWIFLSFTSFWRNSDSYEYKNKSARGGAQYDTCKLFYTMWYLQTVLYHVIPSNCLYHVIPSNCFIPCDTFKLFYTMWYMWKKMLIIIILLRGYSQSQFLSLSGTTITLPRYFAMWCIQIVSYHVIPSSWFIPCDTFKLCYPMWYPQPV